MTQVLSGKKIFGQGRFFGVSNVTNPTPARFGLVQDQTITFKRETKSIFGEKQLAADVSSGSLEVTGKVTYGQTNPRISADLMFGVTGSTGQTVEADDELGTAVSSVVTVANSANWTQDLGVVNVATGVRYVRVASSPVAGVSYTVASGVYTFASGDATVQVKISYLWTNSTAGEILTITNQPMGRIGGFTGVMVFPWTNPYEVVEQDVLTLNNCIASDNEISSKLADYGKPTFGFTSAVDASGNLGTFSFAEAA